MRRHQAELPIAAMARVLGVSTSGYYAWLEREPSNHDLQDAWLLREVEDIHAMSRGTYGAPRVHAELRARGVHVGRKRVARLMRSAGLQGASRRRWKPKTTMRDASMQAAPDLVDRDFTADAPNQLWVADITYVPTGEGFLYLAVVLDAFSRRIVGWSMADHLRTELVLDALDMALQQRRPQRVIHHSDQGCQYTSFAFGRRCREQGVRPSMGSVGDCYDNAMCESFFATVECEFIDRNHLTTRALAKTGLFWFIEGWYNTRRLHSGLGYRSPEQFERVTDESTAIHRASTSCESPPGPPSNHPGTSVPSSSLTVTTTTR
jgi:putative transposase